MTHRLALSQALAVGLAIVVLPACSKPAPLPAAEAGLARSAPAAQPAPVQVSMAGEVNAMPSLAALGDRVVLVWTGTRDGAMNVYSAVSDDRGATFNVQRRVNDQPGDVSSNVEQPPRVAISSAGITVTWSSKKGGNTAIRLARSNDGGKTFSPATTIHKASLTGARGWESIAAAADGGVRVVWLDGRNAQKSADAASHEHQMGDMAARGSAPMDHSKMAGMAARPSPRQDVFEAAIDPSGKVTEALVAANVCFCCKTAVAIGSHGQVFAAWRHIFPGSLRDIAMAVSTDGKTFGPLARVSEDKWEIAGCPEDGPSVALDATDTAHIVWPTVVSEGQTQKVVFYASTKDGRTFTPRVRLSAAGQEEAAHPQIAVGASGTVAAVWDEPHGSVRQIMFRTIGADGQWSAVRALNPAGTASHPVAVPVADGFVVGWTGGEAATAAITLQRIGVSPMVAKPADHKEFTFRGTVESIDAKARNLTVNGEDVEGWMGAMTMVYGVDNGEIVDTVKVGDQITATVRSGDFQTLHGVAIAPR
jgi:Cu/Ag efflux protein CusF